MVKEGLLKSEQIQLEVIKKMQSLYDMLSNDNNVKSSVMNIYVLNTNDVLVEKLLVW